MRNIVSPLSGIRSPFGGRRLSSTEDASTVTWDSSADTYTQSTYGA